MTGGIDVCRTYANQANEENPDWNVILVDPDADHPKKILPYTNEGIGINVNSKNKERAMMVLNELYTNQELYDTAMLGIEGKHWEAVGDDQYKILDNSGWIIDVNIGWGNYTIQRTEYIENRTAVDDACDEMKETWNNNLTEDHPYDSFNFVSDNVSSQYAAVEAVLGTYFDPLVNGLVDDVDASIAELTAALESAGIRDVLEEMEKQAAEYVAE
ncbi:MAG: ABC transporter substrate-binding protein [Eubacteriales bacterium]|nr:ABC transporter substrate-binding protein [Eubacteriales bacterium]